MTPMPVANANAQFVCYVAVQGDLTAAPVPQLAPSTRDLLSGVGALSGIVTVNLVGAKYGELTQSAPAVFSIAGTATKLLIDGKPAVLQGDKATSLVNFASSSGATTQLTVVCECLVAGQTKVLGV